MINIKYIYHNLHNFNIAIIAIKDLPMSNY